MIQWKTIWNNRWTPQLREYLLSNVDSTLSSGSSGKLPGASVPHKNRDTSFLPHQDPGTCLLMSGTNRCDLHSLVPVALWSTHGFTSNVLPPRLCSLCTGHLGTPCLFCLSFCAGVPFLSCWKVLIWLRCTILGEQILLLLIRLSHSPLSAPGFRGKGCAPILYKGSWRRSMEEVLGKTSPLSNQRPKEETDSLLLIGTAISVIPSLYFFRVYFSYP